MKNKPTVISVSILAVFVGYCGWQSYHYRGKPFFGNQHCIYHVQKPPPISPDAVREEQAIIAAASKADENLKVNGKQIVVTGMLPRHFPQ